MAGLGAWLEALGLGQYAQRLAENDIDLEVLPELSEADLQQLGISLGHRKKLLRAIEGLRGGRRRAQPRTSRRKATRRAEAERRQLTVMFCDLVGSTALSARLDPEDLRDLIRAYQERCAAIIVRFEGFVGHYVGDGILAYFGYPQAHEDDPQRAVRAGLEIVEAVQALSSEVAQPGTSLAVRVGIHTGLVVAGDIGSGELRDEMAIVGETPNIAARLQALAEPGTVMIGSNTRRLVEGLFLLEELGPKPVRGIPDPIEVYRVREASDAPSRFEAAAVRGLTPLVGRDEEVQLLLSRWQRATEGEGQVVLLSGEAGIGKSRIVQTLREALAEERHVSLRLFCSPFYAKSSLHPFLDQLERGAGLQRHDSAEAKLDKLESLLAQASHRAAEAAAILAPLMSIPAGSRYPALELTPQQHKARAFDVFAEQLTGLAARVPVLMSIEDVHWIDPSSIELLFRLIERSQHLPALIVMTFRPEFQPPWSILPHVTALSLTRLTQREAATLVSRVVGGKRLPSEVLERIVARTDGVPLFAEELTKAILESGMLEEEGDGYALKGPLPALAIPASLHDSLMARLDRLAPVKEVAQLAAMLGRNFSHELLAAVSSIKDPELARALAQLIEAELLHRRGSPPSVIYDFKHALVQDVAYGSLLRSKRQHLHMRIGTVLETQFPDAVEAKPELLSHHFREAGLPARAIPYALGAGDRAVMRYANVEARTHFLEALDMARCLPDPKESARAQIEATLKLAGAGIDRSHFESDLARLEDAEHLTDLIGDQHALCHLRYWTGRLNYVLGRFDSGVEHARQALELAEALGAEDGVTALPVNLLARLHCLRGEPREAIAHAERNVRQMHELGNHVEEAAISGVLAFAYGMHGEFERAFEAAEHGVHLARTVDHLPTLAACLHFLAVVKGWYGDLETAVPTFEETLAVAEQAGDIFRRYLAHGWRGEAYLAAGRVGPAERDLTTCLELGTRIGTTFHRGAFEAFSARTHLLRGDHEGAWQIGARALEVATETHQAWSRSIALRIHAEILMAAAPRRLGEAEQAARAAIAVQAERECRFDLAWSQQILSGILAAKGDAGGAAEAAAAATGLFESMDISQDTASSHSSSVTP
jgi:class 3 adenylate cyclase/tetratricopeptide (TPR) repeat protein